LLGFVFLITFVKNNNNEFALKAQLRMVFFLNLYYWTLLDGFDISLSVFFAEEFFTFYFVTLILKVKTKNKLL